MSNFFPSRVVSTFTSSRNDQVVIRYPQWDDLEQLTTYINKLSQEQTFIRFSGEHVSLEDERKYLATVFEKNDSGEGVTLFAVVNGSLIGSISINRNHSNYRRSLHAAIFGITLSREYRSQGIGYAFAQTAIEEAKREIEGLRLIWLTVFGINEVGIGLYKKLGFQESGRIPGHILHRGEYVDEVIMYKHLVE